MSERTSSGANAGEFCPALTEWRFSLAELFSALAERFSSLAESVLTASSRLAIAEASSARDKSIGDRGSSVEYIENPNPLVAQCHGRAPVPFRNKKVCAV